MRGGDPGLRLLLVLASRDVEDVERPLGVIVLVLVKPEGALVVKADDPDDGAGGLAWSGDGAFFFCTVRAALGGKSGPRLRGEASGPAVAPLGSGFGLRVQRRRKV